MAAEAGGLIRANTGNCNFVLVDGGGKFPRGTGGQLKMAAVVVRKTQEQGKRRNKRREMGGERKRSRAKNETDSNWSTERRSPMGLAIV